MKFLFLSGHAHLALDPSSQRASGGAELQVALLARELVARGHEAVLLGADTGQEDGVVWEGITVRSGKRFDTGSLGDSLAALPKIIGILRQEAPEVVVVYGWTVWLTILGFLRHLLPFRLVFVCALDAEIDGGFRADHPVRGWLFDRGMRAADIRMGITSHQAALFHKQGMSCGLTRLLLQQLKASADSRKSVDLLWVARCHPVKQPGLFLDLAERLPQARCRMICSDQDAALFAAIRRRAADLPNLEFLDAVPYREIQSHFDEAGVFVNTSDREGVPNTFIHSGLGRTAIVSLAVDPDGMFESFGAGFCARGDFEALVERTGQFLDHPDDLGKAQSEALRFVQEWHDNSANVEAFLAGLEKAED